MDKAFQIVVLGCTGGPKEGDLSGYLLSPLSQQEWIALDAGTLLVGIEAAVQKGSLDQELFTNSELKPSGQMLREHIRAFLISHAHLDHIAGLVLNSQVDTSKAILGIDETIDNMRDHIFNGRIWPNYGDEGVEPVLKRYHYGRLPLHQSVPIEGTGMHVEPYLLSHPRGYPSSAFLIEHQGDYMLYFGDTSPDSMEVEKHLARIWRRAGPLLKEGKLRGMLLECSYSSRESDQARFGHLDTKSMHQELRHFAEIAGHSLENFKVVVTHRKESIARGEDEPGRIEEELRAQNDLGVDFIFPTQGDKIIL